MPDEVEKIPLGDFIPEAPQQKPPVKWNWQVWFGLAFSLACLVLALYKVDLKATLSTLQHVDVLFLFLALGNYFLNTLAKALRWQWLLTIRKKPSLPRTFSILAVGQMVNAFFPARLGELVRAYLMGEAESDNKVYILGTIAVEKVTDMLFLLLSLVVLLPQMALPEWLTGPARGTALVLVILVPCLLVLTWQKDFILRITERMSHLVPVKWRDWLMRQARFGITSLEAVRQPRLLIGLLLWSVLVWVLSALTNYLVFQALDLTLPLSAALLLLVVLHVGTSVPSSPGRVGVFQYLVILSLSVYAVDKNIALGYSIVLYLVIYLSIAVIGGLCLWREKLSWQKLGEAATLLKRLKNGMK
jgi:glycosyltransferase 2 family protein